MAKNANGAYTKARHAKGVFSKAVRRRDARMERRLRNFDERSADGFVCRKPGSQNPKKVSRA